MFVVGNSAGAMANRAVNLEMCIQVGVTGPDVIAEKATGKTIQLGAYETKKRAGEVFQELMRTYEAGGPMAIEGDNHIEDIIEAPDPKVFTMPEE